MSDEEKNEHSCISKYKSALPFSFFVKVFTQQFECYSICMFTRVSMLHFSIGVFMMEDFTNLFITALLFILPFYALCFAMYYHIQDST